MSIDLNKNIKPILAIIIVVLGISYFYMCSLRDIKPDPQILIAIVGSLGVVTGYFFGSSSSSAKKDELIANQPPVVNNADTVNVDNTKSS